MTTVVGLAGPAGVWMAADTRTNIYERPVSGAVKILRLPLADDQAVLVGFSGNAGMPGLARRVWNADRRLPKGAIGLQQWCDEIASLLTEPMVDAGMTDDGPLDGNFLLGVPRAGGDAVDAVDARAPHGDPAPDVVAHDIVDRKEGPDETHGVRRSGRRDSHR